MIALVLYVSFYDCLIELHTWQFTVHLYHTQKYFYDWLIESLTSPLTVHLNQELDGGPPNHLERLEVNCTWGNLGDVGMKIFTWNVKSLQSVDMVL